MVEQFERNITYFLQEEFALDNPFEQELGIGNIDNDDTHIPNVVEFQAMIDNLQRLSTLVGQHFDEKMHAQAEVESKQLKVMVEKTKVVSKYAQALIDEADEDIRKTSKLVSYCGRVRRIVSSTRDYHENNFKDGRTT